MKWRLREEKPEERVGVSLEMKADTYLQMTLERGECSTYLLYITERGLHFDYLCESDSITYGLRLDGSKVKSN